METPENHVLRVIIPYPIVTTHAYRREPIKRPEQGMSKSIDIGTEKERRRHLPAGLAAQNATCDLQNSVQEGRELYLDRTQAGLAMERTDP